MSSSALIMDRQRLLSVGGIARAVSRAAPGDYADGWSGAPQHCQQLPGVVGLDIPGSRTPSETTFPDDGPRTDFTARLTHRYPVQQNQSREPGEVQPRRPRMTRSTSSRSLRVSRATKGSTQSSSTLLSARNTSGTLTSPASASASR